jgi:1-acyl-sn-glycerol-3-phosphate acyltransferase
MKSSSISRFGIKWRQIIHKPITAVFKFSLKHKVKLLRDSFVPNGKPTIFAATHIFYDDIPAILCAMKQHTYLLLGNEGIETTPYLKERLALNLNGFIIVNRGNKQSRLKSMQEMIDVLNKKGNILIFPEAAWNLSTNLIIHHLNWGVINVAKKANANIVPIAVDLVDNKYCVIIGEIFDYSMYKDNNESIEELRSEMAGLAWELIEMKGIVKRESLTDDCWLEHIRKQYIRLPLKDQAKEESYMYRPKNEINLGEVLADMFGIEYKSMASDYKTYKQIEKLIDNWTKPIKRNKG